jgi:hypothetical protein
VLLADFLQARGFGCHDRSLCFRDEVNSGLRMANAARARRLLYCRLAQARLDAGQGQNRLHLCMLKHYPGGSVRRGRCVEN